jgi:hypothetical protein
VIPHSFHTRHELSEEAALLWSHRSLLRCRSSPPSWPPPRGTPRKFGLKAAFKARFSAALACFGASLRGTCSNRVTISRREVEERVLAALRDKLMRRDLFEDFYREYVRELNRRRP